MQYRSQKGCEEKNSIYNETKIFCFVQYARLYDAWSVVWKSNKSCSVYVRLQLLLCSRQRLSGPRLGIRFSSRQQLLDHCCQVFSLPYKQTQTLLQLHHRRLNHFLIITKVKVVFVHDEGQLSELYTLLIYCHQCQLKLYESTVNKSHYVVRVLSIQSFRRQSIA